MGGRSLFDFVTLGPGVGHEKRNRTDVEFVPGSTRIYAALEGFVETLGSGGEFIRGDSGLPKLNLFLRIVVPKFVVIAHKKIGSLLQRFQKFSIAPVLEIAAGHGRQRVVRRSDQWIILIGLVADEEFPGWLPFLGQEIDRAQKGAFAIVILPKTRSKKEGYPPIVDLVRQRRPAENTLFCACLNFDVEPFAWHRIL